MRSYELQKFPPLHIETGVSELKTEEPNLFSNSEVFVFVKYC